MAKEKKANLKIVKYLLFPLADYAEVISKAKPAAKPKVTVFLKNCGIDRATLQDLLPKVKGCKIQPVPEKNSITSYYPEAVPGSRTGSWGTFVAKQKVVRHVLNWAWQEHYKAIGAVCPWNFT